MMDVRAWGRLIVLTVAGGCGPAAGGSEANGDGGTVAETGTGTSSSSGEDESGTGNDDTTTTTGGGANECDMYLQDCPEGDKCNWRVIGTEIVHVCVTVTGDQKLGEPCMHEGVFSGVDDCEDTALCYGAVVIGGGWPGICRAYCGGSEGAPSCEDAGFICSRGDLPACLPECDPLLQDCVGGNEMCFYHEPIPGFVCAETSNAADVGEDCLVPFDCRKGLTCQAADLVAGCPGAECCTELCDMDAPNGCQAAGLGAECVNLMVGGQYDNVGACMLPG